MALRIDKLRFRNILVHGGMAEAPSVEFADALDDTFEEQLHGVATKDDLRTAVADIKADAAEREARITRNQVVIAGVILTGTAIAVAIILALLL